ncbi:hypothetical protein JCM33374_g6671 [Metschnikowia sp. JCM 33374]|nr:hypothetical protein JCM33374_g6671 [Metschnikowia sp. JCM 33374]
MSYLGTEWANNGGERYSSETFDFVHWGEIYREERRDELIRILDLDPNWSMAFISDGEQKSSIGDGQKLKDRVIHLNEGKKTDDIDISQINFKTGIDGVKINETAHKQVETIVALAESLHPLVPLACEDDLIVRGSKKKRPGLQRESTIGTLLGMATISTRTQRWMTTSRRQKQTRIGHENVGSLTNTNEAVNRSNHRMD